MVYLLWGALPPPQKKALIHGEERSAPETVLFGAESVSSSPLRRSQQLPHCVNSSDPRDPIQDMCASKKPQEEEEKSVLGRLRPQVVVVHLVLV